MFIEINEAGEPVALQGKISGFPIRAIDKSEPGDEYYYYENIYLFLKEALKMDKIFF